MMTFLATGQETITASVILVIHTLSPSGNGHIQSHLRVEIQTTFSARLRGCIWSVFSKMESKRLLALAISRFESRQDGRGAVVKGAHNEAQGIYTARLRR